MKRAHIFGSLLLALLGVVAAAHADTAGDYSVILERNPFGLKPPPPPPPPPTNAPPETPTNYKLTGISALFKPTRVMFVNQLPGKPQPEYITLSEGQRQGSLEVVPGGINLRRGEVKVKISGVESTMSFEKNGIKVASTGPAPGAPMPVPIPGMSPNPSLPKPGGTMTAPGMAVPNNAPPSYQPPVQLPVGTPAPTDPNAVPSFNVNRPLRTTGAVSLPLNQQASQPTPPDHGVVDPVRQAVAIEVNRAAFQQQTARGELPPLPPTDLSAPPLPQLPPLP